MCLKCRRTMLMLDILGKLDDFKESFPVDYYKTHINDYLTWLGNNYIKNNLNCQPIYPYIFKGKYAEQFKRIVAELESRTSSSYSKEIIVRILGQDNSQTPPTIHANCACVMDTKSGSMFYEKNVDIRQTTPIAAKILTCIIAIEQGKPDEIYSIPKVSGAYIVAGIKANEQMTLCDMLYGLMLASGNDIAQAIAICVSGSISSFVTEMNSLAKHLDMQNSHFSSSTGLGGDYSTARDIALLTRYALQYPLFREIIATSVYTCSSSLRTYTFENTNALIHQKKKYTNRKYPFSIGGKLGVLNGRYCFVSISRKNEKEHILVQLDITDDSGQLKALDYTFVDAIKIHEWAFTI